MVEVVLERAVVDPDVLGLLDSDEVGGGLGEGEGETLDDNVLDFFHHEPSGGETVLATLVGREDGLREKKRRRQRAVEEKGKKRWRRTVLAPTLMVFWSPLICERWNGQAISVLGVRACVRR